MSLIVQDLTKRYGDKVVVDHLSFRMDQPGVYALLGSNGAGKTTSIRMMLGILARDGGTVLWNDRPLNTDTCNVGYLAEERGLYPKYDLMDQLVYFASLRGVDRAEARKRIKYWAERLEVGEYLYPQMPKPAPEQALLGGRKRRPVMARQKIQKPKKADQLSKGNEQKIQLMKALLYTFPMSELRVHLPRWMDALEPEHPVKAALYQALLQMAEEIHTLGQAEGVLAGLRELPQVQDYSLRSVDLGSGSVICAIVFPEALFYEILSARAGMPIRSDAQLLQLLTELSQIKQEYDKISDALSAVRATGYGVVMPAAEEMKLETPEIIRKGGAYGVKLKAGAPSIHMVRVDIDTEINPMVGDEKQSQDLVNSLMGEDPEKLWQSNIFGKSVYDLIQEGLTTKLLGMPEEVRGKFRGTLTRIVNEGATGLICLIL